MPARGGPAARASRRRAPGGGDGFSGRVDAKRRVPDRYGLSSPRGARLSSTVGPAAEIGTVMQKHPLGASGLPYRRRVACADWMR